jgi:hypothetical protein
MQLISVKQGSEKLIHSLLGTVIDHILALPVLSLDFLPSHFSISATILGIKFNWLALVVAFYSEIECFCLENYVAN